MKQKEKLDKILFYLYKHKFNGSSYDVAGILEENKIDFDINEPRAIAKRLESEGLVKALFSFDGTYVELTSSGVEYCENDSFSSRGKSVVNIFSISNSPNSVIISGDRNTVNYSNEVEIRKHLEELQKEVGNNKQLTVTMMEEIGECLDEINDKVERKRRIPKLLLAGLLSSTADIGTLYPYVKQLIESLKTYNPN